MKYRTSSEGGSSAYSSSAATALVEHFGYDPDMRCIYRENYTYDQWTETIKNELDAGRPLYYSGVSEDGGHAFVCDGYDSDGLFHFNWGWYGNANGYFSLSSVDPFNDGIGSPGGFSRNQDLIIGIQKPDGIDNSSFDIIIYNNGLTSSKSSIADISNEKGVFRVDFGVANWGNKAFKGYVGIGLYKEGVLQEVMDTPDYMSSFDSQSAYSFYYENLSLKGSTAGNYSIYAIYKPDGDISWHKISSGISLNNRIDINITGKTATITTPYTKPNLIQKSAIQTNGKIYKNKTGRFNLTVQNTGYEFYSYISLYIRSTTNNSVNQYLSKRLFLIRSGETQSIELSGNIGLSPGTYEAYAIYDSTNLYSNLNYKQIDKSTFRLIQFTIYDTPAVAALNLNKGISIDGGNTVYAGLPFSLNAEIKNTGGFYNGELYAFIFRPTLGTSLGYIGPTNLYIENNETKTINLTGSFNNDPGDYKVILYYNLNDSNNIFTPENYNTTLITLKKVPVAVEKTTRNNMRIGTNPVGGSIEIITGETVLQADIYDLNGRILGRFNNSSILPSSNLKEGYYILRVTTNSGTTNLSFIK